MDIFMQKVMSTLTKYIFILFTASILWSCEGETNYTKRISNFSNDTLIVEIFNEYKDSTELLFLLPDNSHTLSIQSQLGGNESIPDCSEGIDSVSVVVQSGKTLIKDILNPNDWNHHMISTRRGSLVDHYCDFEILNGDLEY